MQSLTKPMHKITAIEQQQKDVSRYSVYIDGKFSFGIEDLDLYELHLKIGDSLSDAELDAVRARLDETKCKNYAVSLIAKRMYTRKELLKKMQQKGYSPSVMQSTVKIMEEYGYLDDAAYAALFIQQNAVKYGPRKLRYMLHEKGISDSILEELFSSFENKGALKELVERRLRGATLDQALYGKTVRYFLSKGFSYDEIKEELANYTEDVSDIAED